MVTGAVASIIYGEPRLTHDLDLVLELKSQDAADVVNVFDLESYYCPPLEAIRLEANRPLRGHFNIIHHDSGFKADIYIVGEDKLHHWAMARRRHIQFEGETFWVAPIEYVILRKLEYFREGGSEKHLRDIKSMLAVSSDLINEPELTQWIQRLNLDEQWKIASA